MKYAIDSVIFGHLEYNSKLNTQTAEKELAGKPEGTFLIRDSSFNQKKDKKDDSHYFAISYVQNGEIQHSVIRILADRPLLGSQPNKFKTMSPAIDVFDMKNYLSKNSSVYKTPLITDPVKLEMAQKREQSQIVQSQSKERRPPLQIKK